MANFEVKVVKIDSKENHPNADRLTIYKIGGYTCISNKLEDGSDRYNVGDLVVYIPSDSVLPEALLKKMEFWDEEKGKGVLAGSLGNRVKPLKLRGIFSEGVLYPVHCTYETICIDGNTWKKINGCSIEDPVDGGDWAWSENIEGMDVSSLNKITSSVSGIASGLQKLGVEIPEGFEKTIGVLQLITTMISALQTITSIGAFKPFASGGIVRANDGVFVPGSSYSGDRVPALLNSGEMVLNAFQQEALAGTLQNRYNEHGNESTPYVSGEQIYLGLNNYLKRIGRGEMLTARG